jgi:hypothetical protein
LSIFKRRFLRLRVNVVVDFVGRKKLVVAVDVS